MLSNEITYLDLFSGTGGFALGLLLAGFKFKKHYFSEIDDHAIANTHWNFKNAIYVGAVENIDYKEIERPNLVTFGSPCQDISVASGGKGIQGSKSRLFFEAIKVIDRLRPDCFIFENVRNVLSSNKGRDFETILRSIAKIGVYDCQWQLLNSSILLPQNRERLCLVGHLAKGRTPKVFPLEIPFRQAQKIRERETLEIVGSVYKSLQAGRVYSENSKTPALLSEPTNYFFKTSGGVRKLTPIEFERLQGFPDDWTKYGTGEDGKYELADSHRYRLIGNAVSPPLIEMIGKTLLQTKPLTGIITKQKTTKMTVTKNLKTPIAYYGGKQRMVGHILPKIPSHDIYVEPFFGGGAIFFAKQQSKVEIINDKNDHVVNFYRVLKNQNKALCREIEATLHSRSTQRLASSILYNPKFKNQVKKAWAFWVMCNMSFGSNPQKNAGFAYDRNGAVTKKIRNAKQHLIDNFETRLDHVEIENWDALKVISARDSKETFFYLDPPYINTAQGVYEGYSEQQYEDLLKAIAKIKGKFLLSGYPSEILDKYIKKYGWKIQKIEQQLLVTKQKKYSDTKTECLVANYDFEKVKPMEANQSTPINGVPLSGVASKKRNEEQNRELRIIKRFINFHGKLKKKSQVQIFLRIVQKAITSRKITKDSPFACQIMQIQDLLIKLYGFFKSDKDLIKVSINPTTLKDLRAIAKKGRKPLAGVVNPVIPRDRIMNSVDIMKLKFKTLGFKGKWRDLIGDPVPGFTTMIYGRPKMGKSYLAIDFASYLAQNHGKVLYIASEEQISAILQEKLRQKKASHPNLYSVGMIPDDLSDYDFVLIDSVNHYGLSVDDLRDLKAQHPSISFIYIFQTTKSGLFRGSNEFQHDVDVVIEVPERGKATQFGRFNAGGEMIIHEN